MTPLVFSALLVLTVLTAGAARDAARLAEPTLSDLAFMSGCWEGPLESGEDQGVIEEHYTAVSENVMLGTTRYLVQNRTVVFEFSLITHDSTGVTLTPYPNGKRSEHSFRLTTQSNGAAMFEAPEHDYPKRILYRRTERGTLVAQIDGGPDDPQERAWTMAPAPCF